VTVVNSSLKRRPLTSSANQNTAFARQQLPFGNLKHTRGDKKKIDALMLPEEHSLANQGQLVPMIHHTILEQTLGELPAL